MVPFTESEFRWSHRITGRRHIVPLRGGATKRSAADAGRFIVGGKAMCCHGEDMFHFFLSHIIVLKKIEKIMSIIDYHYCCYQYLLFCCVYIHVFSVSWDDCPSFALASPPACDYKNSAFQERNMLWSDPATHTESPKKSEVPSGNLLQSY